MAYNVLVSSDAQEDLSNYLLYLIFEKRNRQAAKSVNEDFLNTKEVLADVADIFHSEECLRDEKFEYRKIHFKKHSYYLMYHIDGDKVIIDHMYHDLQNIKN